jgi:Zn-dependent protease/predicted transcriptional regulator
VDQNIRLGKIAGIPVGINWSVLFVFVLISWELADLVLPHYHPHAGSALYWFVGVAATAIFFGSLIAHEASHAVVAKRNGIGVRRITLWLFGGVSQLESEALTPGADFRIAVAGPITSFVLAGLFGAIGALVPHSGLDGEVVVSALGWLAWMNLILGGFNLMPAAPLDGGRVLRAALWRRSGDRTSAATTAARAGRVFGYFLIAYGVLEFLAVGIIGLWLAFMGWFLLSAASAEEGSVVMRSALADVLVRDIMTADPVTFDANSTVAHLLDSQLQLHRFNSYPLVESQGRVVGLATMNRIRHLPADRRATTTLMEVAAPIADVPVAAPSEPVAELLGRMQSSPDGRALVLDDQSHLVGIVSPSDIARYVQLCMLRSQTRSTK